MTTHTPLPGWRTYINEYFGYQFDYPSSVTIRAEGNISLFPDEKIPEGFTFDEYFSYLGKVLPEDLCVNIESSGVYITIAPPEDTIGRFVQPCPGMGLGSYRKEDAVEVFEVDEQSYTVHGKKLFEESSGQFNSEFYIFNIKGGFRITFISGMPEDGMTPEIYAEQKNIFKKILSTLTRTKKSLIAIPGTTCAGKFTQLVPSAWAQVSPGESPNRVRTGPSKTDEVIAQIYPGTIVKVSEGPVCVDGLIFWKVENKNIQGGVGWTAEGDGKEYYLIPYSR